MRRFYELYNRQQVADDLSLGKAEEIRQQVADELIVERSSVVFQIPWGHHCLLLDKCNNDTDKALFYVEQTLKNNWSRAVLQNWLDTDLYERQSKAITYFSLTLPAPQSDLAQEMTKDPFNFDFLTIRARYDEKELKDALMDSVQRFMMELGTGFAFVGREYRLVVGSTEQFIDLLFYNFQLHCFVVVEMKVTDFTPGDMGQLSTYVAAVDGIMRSEMDQPTIPVTQEADQILQELENQEA